MSPARSTNGEDLELDNHAEQSTSTDVMVLRSDLETLVDHDHLADEHDLTGIRTSSSNDLENSKTSPEDGARGNIMRLRESKHTVKNEDSLGDTDPNKWSPFACKESHLATESTQEYRKQGLCEPIDANIPLLKSGATEESKDFAAGQYVSRRDSLDASRHHAEHIEAHEPAPTVVSQMGLGCEGEVGLRTASSERVQSYISLHDTTSVGLSDAHIFQAEDKRAEYEDTGDSSSHPENDDDDDGFTEQSARSSTFSVSNEQQKKLEQELDYRHSPRISNVSHYSQYQQDDEFVPTVRGPPRPPFRSPSSVKAIQMSSPPPSVVGSSRTSRHSPLPTRLGSPNFSTQYSAKRTPPRFKRHTPPLVLLHVTILPLRWTWANVLENAQTANLSKEARKLREYWRKLLDLMDDTVLERGVLLPHPQNDFEVLEERILEALELPERRRARILECGHYLGSANEMTLFEDDGGDVEATTASPRPPKTNLDRTHRCSTCQSSISFESLGSERIFRVRVYASNGLMKAGAWAACWKDMERIDVELEPIVDPVVDEELANLAAEQGSALDLQESPGDSQTGMHPQDSDSSSLHADSGWPQMTPSLRQSTPCIEFSPAFNDRRERDRERLKEIYGHTPITQNKPLSPMPQSSAAGIQPRGRPLSPSVEGSERRYERHRAHHNASLPALLLKAIGLLAHDKKNVAIGLLTLLIMVLFLRGGRPSQDLPTFQVVAESFETQTVTVTERVAYGTATSDAPTASVTWNCPSGKSTSMDSAGHCVSLPQEAMDVKETGGEPLSSKTQLIDIGASPEILLSTPHVLNPDTLEFVQEFKPVNESPCNDDGDRRVEMNEL